MIKIVPFVTALCLSAQLAAQMPLATPGAAVSRLTAMWTLRGGLDEVKAFADLGVHRLNVPLAAMREANPADGLAKLHDEVISKVA